MCLDVWSRDDIRNVILSANAASAGCPDMEGEQPDGYRAGYEAALAMLAAAFGIPLSANGRLRTPGVIVPGARLAVSYRAEKALSRLLSQREEWRS
jgi:hypothetical protein